MNIYETVTAQVIESIEASGQAPWNRPWVGGSSYPVNAKSGKHYRGVNVVILLTAAWSKGYNSGYWLTFKQAKEFGGNVRKGEKGTKIVFWKLIDDKSKGAKKGDKIPMARAYTVFNAEQCDGLPERFFAEPTKQDKPDARVDAADALMAASECPIKHEGTHAYYRPSTDTITLPPRAFFKSWAGYYSVAFHEMGHATGHESRLDRDIGNVFGSHDYSKEELVAEFTACFLCAHCDIIKHTLDNSARYLRIWVSKLREHPKMLVQAAQRAQKAADRILGAAGQELAA